MSALPYSSPFTIGLLQMSCSANPKENLDKACRMLEEAAAQGVEVACLPELFLTQYFCQKIDPAIFDLAEPIDGPTIQALSKVAAKTKMAIVSSIFERAAGGLYYNTNIMIGTDGKIIGHYRKMHIPHDPLFEEKYYFAPGDLGFKAFDVDTKAGLSKIGTLICWDQWYPEGARITAMQGASVLFYPTAIGWHPAEKAEFGEAQVSAWETMQRSHAIANGVYVGAVNRIGHEVITGDGLEFFGHSFISDPFGRILAMASHNKEEILTATVDPKLIEETRRNWPFFRDRRVDAYAGLTSRWKRE
jgi:N-carbamoylputrescine amidase